MSVLPHEYQMTGTGKRFLLFDSGVEDINRMLIFTTNDGIDMLANPIQWFGDGTFKLCPQIFFQIYQGFRNWVVAGGHVLSNSFQ